MKKKNPPALLTTAADRHLKKLAMLFACLPPLADALILYPLLQIVLANTGNGILYQILSALSQIINLTGFFAVASLSVYCALASALSALGRVLALQGIAYLVLTVLLRTLVQWLLAFLDSTFVLPFAFSNFTLQMLTESDNMMLIWSAVQLFINVILMMVLLVIVVAITLVIRQKQTASLTLESLADGSAGSSFSLVLRITALIYLIQAFINQLLTTLDLVKGSDASDVIANLATILAPYFLLAIYTFIGYWVMQTILRRVAEKTLSLCQAE